MGNAHWLADYLVERAIESDLSPDGTLGFAAHLYAATEVLFEDLASAPRGLNSLPDQPPAAPRSMKMLLSAFRERGSLRSLDTAALLARCTTALVFLDGELGKGSASAAFPRFTAVGDPGSNPREISVSAPLTGAVRVWLRPDRAWERVVTPPPYDGPWECLRRVAMFWERPAVRRSPSVRPVSPPPSSKPYDLDAREGFSIALCPLMGAYRPTFTLVDGTSGFTVESRIQPHKDLLQQIESTLQIAIGNNVKCLVFPELSVDLAARNATTRYLFDQGRHNSLRSVIAGSFHSPEKHGDHYAHDSAGLTGSGKPLFEQRKPGSLELPSSAVRGAPTDQAMLRELNAPATELNVLETAAGRFAVIVASDATCPQLPLFAKAARPDFLVLLAFSAAPSAFVNVAEDLALFGISTFFVQAHGAVAARAPTEGDDPVLAFARLAIPSGNSAALPQRWRFRWKARVEVSHKAGSPWIPLPDNLRIFADELRTVHIPETPHGLVLNIGHLFAHLVRRHS